MGDVDDLFAITVPSAASVRSLRSSTADCAESRASAVHTGRRDTAGKRSANETRRLRDDVRGAYAPELVRLLITTYRVPIVPDLFSFMRRCCVHLQCEQSIATWQVCIECLLEVNVSGAQNVLAKYWWSSYRLSNQAIGP